MLVIAKALTATWFDFGQGEPRTEFKIKAMTGIGRYSFLSNPRVQAIKFDTENCREMISDCLVDWRGVHDTDNSIVAFPGGDVAVNMLDQDSIQFIVNTIMKLTFANDDDKKKSS